MITGDGASTPDHLDVSVCEENSKESEVKTALKLKRSQGEGKSGRRPPFNALSVWRK